jgi:hypothetical protein
MTPTHKPEDGDREPISSGGAEPNDRACIHCGGTTVCRAKGHPCRDGEPLSTSTYADALASALEDMREIDFDDVFVKAAAELRRLAALSQPHPHGG